MEEEPPAQPEPEPVAKPAPAEEKKMMPPQQDPQAMMAMMMGAKPQEDRNKVKDTNAAAE